MTNVEIMLRIKFENLTSEQVDELNSDPLVYIDKNAALSNADIETQQY